MLSCTNAVCIRKPAVCGHSFYSPCLSQAHLLLCMQVEHERVRHTEQAKDDLQFSLEEKVRKVDAAHTKILQDTMAAYDQ